MANTDDSLKKTLVNFYVYFLLGPSIFLWHYFDRLKIIYALPFVFVGLVFLYNLLYSKDKKDNISFKNKYLYVVLGYFIICLVSISLNLNSSLNWAGINRDILVFSTPFIIYGFNLSYNLNHVKYLLFISICSYFAIVGLESDFSIHLSLFKTSASNNEFHAGILFGLFLIAFFVYKKYYWLLISIFFILLASKRAIFLGLIPAFLIFYTLIKPFKLYEKRNNWLVFILTLVYYFILYPISINLEGFSGWALNLFTSGEYNTVDFLMKREVFVDLLNAQIFSGDFIDFVFGHGPGQADIYLQTGGLPGFMKYLLRSPINPHNEFCKLHFDLGIVGVCYFFVMAYTMYINNSKAGILIFLFTIPTFLVDNPLIFIYFSHIANIIVNINEHNEQHLIST